MKKASKSSTLNSIFSVSVVDGIVSLVLYDSSFESSDNWIGFCFGFFATFLLLSTLATVSDAISSTQKSETTRAIAHLYQVVSTYGLNEGETAQLVNLYKKAISTYDSTEMTDINGRQDVARQVQISDISINSDNQT